MWAVVNTVTRKAVPFDAGVVACLFPVAAGIAGLVSCMPSVAVLNMNDDAHQGDVLIPKATSSVPRVYHVLCIVAHLVMAATYALAAAAGWNVAYCCCGAMAWILTGIFATAVSFHWKNADGKDVEDLPPIVHTQKRALGLSTKETLTSSAQKRNPETYADALAGVRVCWRVCGTKTQK